MKIPWLLLLILAGVWLWRQRQVKVNQEKSQPKPAQPQDMLRCAHCGLHLPDSEAVKGLLGSYCCQDHLRQAEH